MEFRVFFILSAICLLINFNIANASNIISGNNLKNNVQRSSTVVVDGNGHGRNQNNYGDNNNNKNGYDQSYVSSSVHVDANGNRQSTYDIKRNINSGLKINAGGIGINVDTGNANAQNHISSSVNVNANGYGRRGANVNPYGGGAGNKILGNGNNDNIQTNVRG